MENKKNLRMRGGVEKGDDNKWYGIITIGPFDTINEAKESAAGAHGIICNAFEALKAQPGKVN